MKTHIMIDIETLGKKAGCPVLSMGAVAFTQEGVNVVINPDTFYGKIGRSSYPIKYKTNIDWSTLDWWMDQPETVRKEAFSGRSGYTFVLDRFHRWLYENVGFDSQSLIYAKPSTFDIPILEALFEDVDEEGPPWDFRQVRCAKTLFDDWGVDEKTLISRYSLVAHNPLDDALGQTMALIACILKKETGKTLDLLYESLDEIMKKFAHSR